MLVGRIALSCKQESARRISAYCACIVGKFCCFCLSVHGGNESTHLTERVLNPCSLALFAALLLTQLLTTGYEWSRPGRCDERLIDLLVAVLPEEGVPMSRS